MPKLTSKTQSLGVLIGRFQPFHNGHEYLVQHALANADRLLIVVGSACAARNLRNPWTLAEREQMIRSTLALEQQARVEVAGIPDVFYCDGEWAGRVRHVVETHAGGEAVRLFGHTKDASSYYLSMFPEWHYEELPNFEGLSATPIREELLATAHEHVPGLLETDLAPSLPEGVRRWLHEFCRTEAFREILEEAAAVDRFQTEWSGSPYPPSFVTVDALVEWCDEVLLIRRKGRPGKGLFALPGGFLDPGERLEAGCRRELEEETGLQLPADLTAEATFVGDHPDRSDRGRFITHVFHFRLAADQSRPVVKGGDDAASASWVRRDQIPREQVFEDHYLLMEHMLGSLD